MMFSTCPFVCLSIYYLLPNLWRQYFEMNAWFWCQLAQVVHGAMAWNINFGSQEAKDQCDTRARIDFKCWRSHHSRPLGSDRFTSSFSVNSSLDMVLLWVLKSFLSSVTFVSLRQKCIVMLTVHLTVNLTVFTCLHFYLMTCYLFEVVPMLLLLLLNYTVHQLDQHLAQLEAVTATEKFAFWAAT